MFDPTKPLWLPEGSVRSLLALTVVASFIAGLVNDEVALLVLGFYFGSRSGAQG